MKLPSHGKAMLVGAGLGAIAPAYHFIRLALDWRYGITEPLPYFWPSCIWLGATLGAEHTFSGYVIVALSICANLFLYALAAAVVLLLLRVIFRRATPTV